MSVLTYVNIFGFEPTNRVKDRIVGTVSRLSRCKKVLGFDDSVAFWVLVHDDWHFQRAGGLKYPFHIGCVFG